MTVSHRKTKTAAKPDDRTAAEPGVQYHCDVCEADITLTVRIRCAGGCKEFDLCGSCFCAGAEAKQHKAHHAYRIVEQHAYPIFAPDWGADEELLLIDGCQQYGLGNWADIADHIGNRSKEEVEAHYTQVFVEGRDGTDRGDKRAREADEHDERNPLRTSRQLPVRGPNMEYVATISADAFHQAKRQRISDLRSRQAALPIGSQKGAPPKPLVSAPTSHHELSGFMAGRLEFETEHEQDAETLTKDMEFGKVYRFGGELLPSEEQALGGKAVAGRSRMEASGRGGASARGAGASSGAKGGGGGSGGANGSSKDGEDETQQKGGEDGEGGDDDDRDAEEKADDDDADANAADKDDADQNDATADDKGDNADDAASTAANDEVAAANSALPSSSAAEAAPPAEPSERPPADWDEDPSDCDLKLMILQLYNERLERRTERKRAILERGLVEVRRRQAAERRRPKEDRDLLARIRHFAPMMTPLDFERFLDGLCYQETLTRIASQLQEFRRGGVRNLVEANKYEGEKAERIRKAQQMAEEEYGGPIPAALLGVKQQHRKKGSGRDSETPFGDDDVGVTAAAASAAATPTPAIAPTAALPVPSLAAATTNGKASAAGGAGGGKAKKDKEGNASKDKSKDQPKEPRKPPRPLDLSSHQSLHLLTRPEQILCSVQRIQPSAFFVMKKEILTEYIRRSGKMSRRETRVLFKMDVNKVGKVYDLLEEQGYLEAAKTMHWSGGDDGIGTPPGWREPPPPPAAANAPAPSHPNGTANVNGNHGAAPLTNGGGPPPSTSAPTPTPMLHVNGRGGGGNADESSSGGNAAANRNPSPYRPTAAV